MITFAHKLRRTSRLLVATSALLLLLASLSSCVSLQSADTPKAAAPEAFAETFLQACAKKDVPRIKTMMALPFHVLAPCKGGPFDTLEDLMESAAWDAFIEQGGPRRTKRVVLTLEQYFRSLDPQGQHEKDMQRMMNALGREVQVVCLHGEDNRGIAVLLRRGGGVRAIGVGMLPP